jgi:hypothetical protein
VHLKFEMRQIENIWIFRVHSNYSVKSYLSSCMQNKRSILYCIYPPLLSQSVAPRSCLLPTQPQCFSSRPFQLFTLTCVRHSSVHSRLRRPTRLCFSMTTSLPQNVTVVIALMVLLAVLVAGPTPMHPTALSSPK